MNKPAPIAQPENSRSVMFSVPSLPELNQLVAKLAKTAKRFKLSPLPELIVDWSTRCEKTRKYITNTTDGAELVDQQVRTAQFECVTGYLILPDLGAVKAAGNWVVAGMLQRTDREELEMNVFRSEHRQICTNYRDQKRMACDHCNANRHRTKVFVLVDGDRSIQVGRECMKTYVTDLSLALNAFEFESIISNTFDVEDGGSEFEYGFSSGKILKTYDLAPAMTILALLLRESGFVASSHVTNEGTAFERRDRNENATWRVTARILDRKSLWPSDWATKEDAAEVAKQITRCDIPVFYTPADAAKGAELLNWARNLPEQTENEFIASIREIAQREFITTRGLATLAAIEIAKARYEREADAKANPPGDAPSDRQTVTATILKTEIRDSDFGPVHKMLAELTNRARVWGSLPAAKGTEVQLKAGDVIEFSAKFEVSQKDKSFAFFSRPTKGKIVSVS